MKMPLKKERVFRVIIERDVFNFKFVRENTKLSKSFVSKTLSELIEKNLIIKCENEYKVINKEYLLKEWATMKRKILNSLKPLKLFFFMKDNIKEVFKNCAISGSFAEYLMNGQTQGEEVITYVTKDSINNKKISRYISKKPNTFVYVYDEHVFSNSWKIKGWQMVSVPQLCADLISQGIYADVALDLFKRWLNANRRRNL